MKLQGSLSSYKKGEFLHESQKMKKLKNEPGKKTKSKSFRSTIIDVKLLRVKVHSLGTNCHMKSLLITDYLG